MPNDSRENPQPKPRSSLEDRIRKIMSAMLRIGLILMVLLLVGGIFYRPFLYARLLMLLSVVFGIAFSTPLTRKDYLAMLWWDRDRK